MARRSSLLAILACAVAALGGAQSAGASVAIKQLEIMPSATQAGGHPNIHIRFEVETRVSPVTTDPCRCNSLRDATISMPEGVIGNPHATPQCAAVDFALDRCPVDSQVGVIKPSIIFNDSCCFFFSTPVYNIVPLPDQAGLLGFKAILFDFPTYEVLSARTGSDYGLDATVRGASQAFALGSVDQTLWGVPADPANDGQRYKRGGPFPEPVPTASNSPMIPFLQSPITCTSGLSSELTVTAYDNGITHKVVPWPETTGCEQLGFTPSLAAQPDTEQADTASGLDVELSVPQVLSPSTPSGSEIKSTTVTLPEGFSINPNAADGKLSCDELESRIGTEEAAQCPDQAKVGTVRLTSTALPAPIDGSIYLGEPRPGDRYRLILTADGFGTHVKLQGSVSADQQDGRLVASFPDLPQSPFSEFDLHFFGSERGLLATPTRCGTYPVETAFVPWDTALPEHESTQFFHISSGPGGAPCPTNPRAFSPAFAASPRSSSAGAHSPFALEINRADGEQNLSSVSVHTPPGLLATLRGVSYCPEATLAALGAPTSSGAAERATPACPASSRVGSATAGAGAGTHPLYLPGGVYLAGPYRGAPLSLAVVTPAVSGPYDLGNVVVRVALQIDPVDARITAISDPLPSILDGIPLRLRSILIDLDRPGFTLNPTNCDPFAVSAALAGAEGGQSAPATHFQVSNCNVLDFGPSLKLRLTGSTKRRANPGLVATLTAHSGDADIGSAAVTLPPTELLDNRHIDQPCTRVQFAADACPPGSVIGHATAETPLLDQPLEGPVYLRSSSHQLPDVVAALHGQIDIDLAGRIDTVKGGLRTRFETVPDAPVSSFVLALDGGKRGLLQNSANVCHGIPPAKVLFGGQNGKRSNANVALGSSCGAHSRHKRSGRAGR